MAADRSRLAAALAYRQAEEERRRRMMESVPVPGAEMPAPAPSQNFRRDLENLSIGIGEGLTNQLEGVKGIVTDPIGAARGAYEGVRAVVRDPSIIADALRYTAQKATSGPLGAGEVIGEMLGPRKGGPMMQELDVYHGTPHRFPATEANPLGEFDASKIGTGEGAQAFGHGIYLAEKPTVAQDYQFMLSKIDPSTTTYQGKPVEKWYEMAQAEQDRAHRLRDQKAIDRANAKLAFWENVMTRRHPEDAKRVANDPDDGWPALANYANSLDMSKFGGIGEAGSLYKADLPDEMIDRMLDWDKPLKNQSKAVKQAIASNPQLAQFMEKGNREMTGAEFHNWAQDQVTPPPGDWGFLKTDIELSRLLKEAGIPGIKYKDAGSRGKRGTGTRNFVVFPGEEKKVRILERDGQKAPPQKIAQALEATSKSQNLVDVFNKTAKREIELANKRIVDPDEPYLTQQPISNLKELDQLTDPIFNYAKANVLKHIGEKNGFKVKIEGSNVSPSVYAKFTKVDDEGVTDFKVRISDHADVSRNKPAGEKKAYDINPDSNGSMEEIIQLLNDQNWLKQFYELD